MQRDLLCLQGLCVAELCIRPPEQHCAALPTAARTAALALAVGGSLSSYTPKEPRHRGGRLPKKDYWGLLGPIKSIWPFWKALGVWDEPPGFVGGGVS